MMRVFSLYRDFFKFLEKLVSHPDKWNIYLKHYYHPYREFLENYFSHFPLINFSSLKQRIETVKASDYSQLISLISTCAPERIIQDAYEKCIRIVPPAKEPDVYLFIGFFSPDGFVMNFRGKPVICFGLERFKDFALLGILFAHEYAHFLLNLSRGDIPEEKKLKWLLISEGVGTYFSTLAFPEQKLSDHFLFKRDRFNWCQANESRLREIYLSGKFSSQELLELYARGNSELDVPPRSGKYLGFQAVKRYLSQKGEENFASLFSHKKAVLSLEL